MLLGEFCSILDIKQKVKFCIPLTSLFLSSEDFRDAFCVAGVPLDNYCNCCWWTQYGVLFFAIYVTLQAGATKCSHTLSIADFQVVNYARWMPETCVLVYRRTPWWGWRVPSRAASVDPASDRPFAPHCRTLSTARGSRSVSLLKASGPVTFVHRSVFIYL